MKVSYPQEMQDWPLDAGFLGWLESWQRGLEASTRAHKTILIYRVAMTRLGKFVAWRYHQVDVLSITRQHIEEFLIFTVNTNHSAYTVSTYYQAINRFYKWLLEEGEIAVNPVEKIRTPKVPETDREVMSVEHITALIKSCDGNEFNQRRDAAIIRVLIDTGMRLSELTCVTLTDVDLKEKTIHIPKAKGGKNRDVPIGVKTAAALDRYLRKRATHKFVESERLWVGKEGPLAAHTIYRMIDYRCKRTGLPHSFPHQFRHTFSHMWLADGGQEGDLKAIGGWTSDVMARYGRKLKGDRAREAHKKHSPGDQF